VIRLALLNPNANAETTARMTAVARQAVGPAVSIEGFTARSGPLVIADEEALEKAARLAIERGEELAAEGFRGILISGFGDPGLDRLRRRISISVTGIAEAGMKEASLKGRRFSIVTTTPELKAAIMRRAVRLGHGNNLISVRIAGSVEVMSDPERLAQTLLASCHEAVSEEGAEAILIGGGPLADAARTIAPMVPVPVIEPVAAGARLACARAGVVVGSKV